MSELKLAIKVNFLEEEIYNKYFIDLYDVLIKNILKKFNKNLNYEIYNTRINFDNPDFEILDRIFTLNSINYILKSKTGQYYFLKQSNGIRVSNSNITRFVNEINQPNSDQLHWKNILRNQLEDVINEDENYRNYDLLIKNFKNNFIEIYKIHQGFINEKQLKFFNNNYRNYISENGPIRIDYPPSTFILCKYYIDSITLRKATKIVSQEELFKIYIVLVYIFAYANLNGQYHNDLKSNNIILINKKINFKSDILYNIKSDIILNYTPIIIDYSNSKKTSVCFPFDIYLISKLFNNKPIFSEISCCEPEYINNLKFNNLIDQVLYCIELEYKNINDIIVVDRLHSKEFYDSLENNAYKYKNLIKKIFNILIPN